jgi:hypothetical protein
MNRAKKHDSSARRVPAKPVKPFVLKNPVQISEDEADAIISTRRLSETSITLEEYLRKRGHALDR